MSASQVVKKPKQERSRLTREAILAAALDILEHNGIDKISTNLIARTAGINIATLYKHFADKFEILNELALAFSQKQSDLICTFLDETPTDTDLQTVCHGIVDAIVEGTKNDRALVQLQRALIIYPELHSSYQRTNVEIGEAMKPFLDQWNIEMSPKELSNAMLCLGEMFGALQDLALSGSSSYNPAVIDELKRLVTAYYRDRSRNLSTG